MPWAKCPFPCSNTDGNHLLGAKDPAYLNASCRPSTRTRDSAFKGYDNERTKTRSNRKRNDRDDNAGGHGPTQREGPVVHHELGARIGPGPNQGADHHGGGTGRHLPPAGADQCADGAGGLDQLLPCRASARLAGIPGQSAARGRGLGTLRQGPRQRPHRRAQHRLGVRAQKRRTGGLRPFAAVPRIPRPLVRVP